MSTPSEDPDVDLRPWAAYVLGRNPRTLSLRHTAFWNQLHPSGNPDRRGPLDRLREDYGEIPFRANEPGPWDPILQDLEGLARAPSILDYGPGPWDRIEHETDEIDHALRILARIDRLVAGPLDAFRKSLGEFQRIHAEMINYCNNYFYESEICEEYSSEHGPAYPCLMDLARHSASLIRSGDELPGWRSFGDAVVAMQDVAYFGTQAVDDVGMPVGPHPLRVVKKFARELEDGERYPLPGAVSEALAALVPRNPWWIGAAPEPYGVLGAELYRLDHLVVDLLKRQAPPAKLLELDREQLIFFGERYYIHRPPPGRSAEEYAGGIPRPEAAFLWVLAESPGQEFGRETIIREANLGRGDEALQHTALRLRRPLKAAVKRYYKRRGVPLTKHAKRCFIVAASDKKVRVPVGPKKGSPYTLTLDRGRVWVHPERPPWMPPKSPNIDSL